MFDSQSFKKLINNPKLKSLLSNLIQLIETPVSIEDIEGNLLLGQSITTMEAAEFLILVEQQAVGSVKGDSSTQIIAQLLSYLANQEKLVLFDDLVQIPNRRYFNLQEQHIAHFPSPVNPSVTISLGIAVTIPTAILSPQTLFEMADMALYRAKAKGRNRYCLQAIFGENSS